MTKQSQVYTEAYEIREHLRRHEFLERMEQKWLSKAQAYKGANRQPTAD